MGIRIRTDELRAHCWHTDVTDPGPFCHLDAADLDLIQGLLGEQNRLGFAVMLGSARCLGTFPDQEADKPARVLDNWICSAL